MSVKPMFTKSVPPKFSSREMRDDYYRSLHAKRYGLDPVGNPIDNKPEQAADAFSLDIPWSLSKLVIGIVLLFKFIDRLAKLMWHAFAVVTLVTIAILLTGVLLG